MLWYQKAQGGQMGFGYGLGDVVLLWHGCRRLYFLKDAPLYKCKRFLFASGRHSEAVRLLHAEINHHARSVIDFICDNLDSSDDPGRLSKDVERKCESFYTRCTDAIANVFSNDLPGKTACILWVTVKPSDLVNFAVFKDYLATHGNDIHRVTKLAGGSGPELNARDEGFSDRIPFALIRGASNKASIRDELCPFWFTNGCSPMKYFVDATAPRTAGGDTFDRSANFVTDFDVSKIAKCRKNDYFDPLPVGDRGRIYKSVAVVPLRIKANSPDAKAIAGFLWLDNPRAKVFTSVIKKNVPRTEYTARMHFLHGVADACAAVARLEHLAVDEFAARAVCRASGSPSPSR